MALILFIGACDSANNESGAVTPEFSDPAIQLIAYLRTGLDEYDRENSWFCTYTFEKQFAARKQIHIFDNGNALVDGISGHWNIDNLSFSLSYGDTNEHLSNVVFSRRKSTADKFKSTSNRGYELACDLSGPPRNLGGLEDEIIIPDVEEMARSTLDVLLSNGNNQEEHDSWWSCQVDSYNSPEFELFLFDDGSMISTTAGRWSRKSSTSIELTINDISAVWKNIEISPSELGGQYGAFSAETESKDRVSCIWSGYPRATVWQAIE